MNTEQQYNANVATLARLLQLVLDTGAERARMERSLAQAREKEMEARRALQDHAQITGILDKMMLQHMAMS